ncbi:MAG: imidazolonepropionase, partial [Nitrospinales bacterium]
MKKKIAETCYRNIGELIQIEAASLPRLKVRKKCALVVEKGRVVKVIRDAVVKPSDFSKVVDMGSKAVIPGFVDCHTHLIFAGERKDEMEDRAQGKTYQEIMERGGGILSTVRETR